MTDADQCMSTPGYPNQYTNDLMCSWSLSAPDGMKVSCEFEDFSLEQGYDTLSLGKFTIGNVSPHLLDKGEIGMAFTHQAHP